MTTAPGKSRTKDSTPAFDFPSFGEATKSFRTLNQQLVGSYKGAGLKTLDAYEQVVTGIVDFEKKAASDSRVEWVSTIAAFHAQVLTDMTASCTTMVRNLLK